MGVLWNLHSNGLASLLDVEIGPAEKAVSFAQSANFLSVETATFQTYLVNPPDLRWIPICNHERRNVLNDLRAAPQDSMSSNFAELVDPAESTDDRIVLDDDVAGERTVIGENYMVSDEAIMGYM